MPAIKDNSKETFDDAVPDSSDTSLAVGSAGGTPPVVKTRAGGDGFFHPYKKGQGKVTRLSTAAAAAGILALTCNWLYSNLSITLGDALVSGGRTREAAVSLGRNISLLSATLIFLIGAFFAWRMMNSPRGADFLITTDHEMNKVNWASRKELFGSTRVVVIFLFFICIFLFCADIFFGWFFHVIGVLKTGPFAS